MSVWNQLKNFSPQENWGKAANMNGLLLLLLDRITTEVKQFTWNNYKKISPCIIHCGYKNSGHSPNSQHYKGNAADFHFENISPLETYQIIIKTLENTQTENFVGLGIYPEWQTSGFHLDVRGYNARWAQVEGSYVTIETGVEKL